MTKQTWTTPTLIALDSGAEAGGAIPFFFETEVILNDDLIGEAKGES